MEYDQAINPVFYYNYNSTLQNAKGQKKNCNILSARQSAILDSVPDTIMEVDNKQIFTPGLTLPGKLQVFGDDVIGKELA